MKLIMYSHIGDSRIVYTNFPFSNRGYSVYNKHSRFEPRCNVRVLWFEFTINKITTVGLLLITFHKNRFQRLVSNILMGNFFHDLLTSTFSTTCLPNEQTFVETEMVVLSTPSYLRHDNRI